jgi:putative ABC transport system substrate-binding protein
MRKIFVLLLTVVLCIGIFAGCGTQKNDAEEQSSKSDEVKLGIIQIVEHEALDASRNGFLDVLKENGYAEGENLKVDYQNAQGDMPTAQTIAKKFVSEKSDLVLAIATPTAQAMAGATAEIPILITAVTDPVGAQLVNSMEKPETNVTGTTDMNPVKEQLQLMKELVPNVKNVGIIFNTSEQNSEVQVEIARQAAPELGLELKEAVATNSSEVMQAAQSLVGKVDAIYVPTDNTVVSAVESVIKVSEDNNIPIISGESSTVKKGALGTVGIDYYKLGRQTGEMALDIINGKNPAEMPVQKQKEMSVVINKNTADKFSLEIPQSILDKAEIIE